jgi:hypothetical protein
VGPTPVGVEDDGSRLGCAAGTAGTSASLPGQLRMSLSLRCANLLGAGGSKERKCSESESPVHDCCCAENCCWMLRESSGGGKSSYIDGCGHTPLSFRYTANVPI